MLARVSKYTLTVSRSNDDNVRYVILMDLA